MKITIGGSCGTGKDTTAELLAQALGYPPPRSASSVIREAATHHGMTVEAFVKAGYARGYDERIDNDTKEYGKMHDNFVYLGRLPWYFIPDSFKILLVCELGIRVDRMMKREEEKSWTQLQAFREILTRDAKDRGRYRVEYGIENYADPRHYDLVVDTSFNRPRQVVDEICERIKQLQRRVA